MTEHFEALEADFLAHYRVDLREAVFGRTQIGGRRLLALVRGLPPKAAFWRSLEHAEKRRPTPKDEVARFFSGNVVVSKGPE